jgi:hypothetical protein
MKRENGGIELYMLRLALCASSEHMPALHVEIDIGGILGVITCGGFTEESICIEGSASVLLKIGSC